MANIQPNKVYNIDCLELIKKIPDNYVDLILTDPPFLVSKYKWDTFNNFQILFDEFYRICKTGASFYIFWPTKYIFNFFDYKIKFDFKRFLVWHNKNLSKFNPKSFTYSFTFILYLIKGKSKTFNGSHKDIFIYPIPQSNFKKDKKYHPAQKPLELIKKIISISSNENAIVFDPFGGAGTTFIAARELNRKFLGCEIDKNFYNIIIERLKNEKETK